MIPKLGDLRWFVEIQTRAMTPDGKGGQTVSWKSIGGMYANVKALSAKELFYTGKAEQEISHNVQMRFVSGIKRGDRIYWNQFEQQAVVLNVQTVRIIDPMNQWMSIDCYEEKA